MEFIPDFLRAWFQVHPIAGILLGLMIADVATGTLRAIRDKKIASDVSTAGITRKAAIIIAVLVGYMLVPIAPGLPVGDTLAVWYCIAEVMSLIENLALLNAPLPASWKQYFAKLAENAGDKNIVKPIIQSFVDPSQKQNNG